MTLLKITEMSEPPGPPPSFSVGLTREFIVAASVCEVWLRVTGARYLTGHAVFEQAGEVAKVVAAATAAGVPRGDVHLAEVSIDSRSRIVTTTTEATYVLRIDLREFSLLADLLTAATGPKTCELARTVWRFEEDAARVDGWVAEVLRDVRRRAGAMAAAAGVTLGPVLEITHHHGEAGGHADGSQADSMMLGDFDEAPARRRRVADSLPGPVERERTVAVTAGMRFGIGGEIDAA